MKSSKSSHHLILEIYNNLSSIGVMHDDGCMSSVLRDSRPRRLLPHLEGNLDTAHDLPRKQCDIDGV